MLRKPVGKSIGLSKKPLKTTTSLKRNISQAKKSKPRKKLEEKTASELIKPADEAFSKYIRLRDSAWVDGRRVGHCVDCDKVKIVYSDGKWTKGTDNGHYVSRGVMSMRYDEMNCHLQDSHCNAWRDKSDVERDYSKALDKLYGKGTAQELKDLSKEPNSRRLPPKADLLDIIYTCRAYIKKELGQKA